MNSTLMSSSAVGVQEAMATTSRYRMSSSAQSCAITTCIAAELSMTQRNTDRSRDCPPVSRQTPSCWRKPGSSLRLSQTPHSAPISGLWSPATGLLTRKRRCVASSTCSPRPKPSIWSRVPSPRPVILTRYLLSPSASSATSPFATPMPRSTTISGTPLPKTLSLPRNLLWNRCRSDSHIVHIKKREADVLSFFFLILNVSLQLNSNNHSYNLNRNSLHNLFNYLHYHFFRNINLTHYHELSPFYFHHHQLLHILCKLLLFCSCTHTPARNDSKKTNR